MEILRNILRFTLRHRKKHFDKTRMLLVEVEDMIRWGRIHRRAWNGPGRRYIPERLGKIARSGRPLTRRPLGRPPKQRTVIESTF